jgi:DNA-binding GntR family transcriptional regulator
MAENSVDDLRYEQLVRGDSLADQVYRQLATAILSGSFAPSERINIRRLAEEIGISVTPAREAIVRLVADGVLQTSEKSAILVPERTEAEIVEIFTIRRSLEGDMAETAALSLTDEDVCFLEETQKRFLKSLDESNYKDVLRLNSMFHFHIYERSGLPLHLKITESLWLRIGPTLRYMYPILHKNRSDHRRHEDIIESAARRDPAALRSAILGDLDSSQVALMQYIEACNAERALRGGRNRI